ncbi:hypothetical protein [Halomonas heilongjiangensis]|nr:hypothetical protein [Halomonas heilongjiangensis]
MTPPEHPGPAGSQYPAPERRGRLKAATTCHLYRAYGLTVASQIPLPELTPAVDAGASDIRILTPGTLGNLSPESAGWPWLELGETCCQILVQGIARYRVEQGQRILVDRRVPRAQGGAGDDGDVRLYLLGVAFGLLLHQRHWLPLHVSALNTPAGVWAFTGDSGAGKSTLGAWLHYHRGWPLISDDVAVVKPEEALPHLYPGPPRLKLWQDALAALGIDRQGLVRDLMRADKYHLNGHRGFQERPLPLQALVSLERAEEGERPSLARVTGADAFRVVMSALYRPELGRSFTTPEALLGMATSLTMKIAVYRFRRPWSLARMEANLAPLFEQIEASAARGGGAD